MFHRRTTLDRMFGWDFHFVEMEFLFIQSRSMEHQTDVVGSYLQRKVHFSDNSNFIVDYLCPCDGTYSGVEQSRLLYTESAVLHPSALRHSEQFPKRASTGGQCLFQDIFPSVCFWMRLFPDLKG